MAWRRARRPVRRRPKSISLRLGMRSSDTRVRPATWRPSALIMEEGLLSPRLGGRRRGPYPGPSVSGRRRGCNVASAHQESPARERRRNRLEINGFDARPTHVIAQTGARGGVAHSLLLREAALSDNGNPAVRLGRKAWAQGPRAT